MQGFGKVIGMLLTCAALLSIGRDFFTHIPIIGLYRGVLHGPIHYYFHNSWPWGWWIPGGEFIDVFLVYVGVLTFNHVGDITLSNLSMTSLIRKVTLGVLAMIMIGATGLFAVGAATTLIYEFTLEGLDWPAMIIITILFLVSEYTAEGGIGRKTWLSMAIAVSTLALVELTSPKEDGISLDAETATAWMS